ncbi:MAG: hypothetical protein KJO82_10460 [Gammaproteobacteria bacterium]|nr:hypothetical protein [Gammaproteobacteria bacterium]
MLSACAAGPSMQQLETTAMLTGDWSAVEKRERSLERRAQRRGKTCPQDLVSLCDGSFGEKRCSCVSHETLSRVLHGY